MRSLCREASRTPLLLLEHRPRYFHVLYRHSSEWIRHALGSAIPCSGTVASGSMKSQTRRKEGREAGKCPASLKDT
ncbi:hypothetical protein VULLAG_LOCUS5205 [Vulpes lagopus]